VVEASREQRVELFRAAIGGYGAVGVITEIELELASNTKIARDVDYPSLDEYVAFFQTQVQADSKAVMHNADLSPPLFNRPVAVTWRESEAELTLTERLTPRDLRYALEQSMIFLLTESPQMSAEKVRSKVIEPMRLKGDIVQWRNREASLDVAQLEPASRLISTYVLQEYFIPVRHFLGFVHGMVQILQVHEANVLNVSIRHSPADELALMPWAREEVFSFVFFYKQRVFDGALRDVATWTRALIDLALTHEGRYYLPYQLHATREQFERAYPEVAALRGVKKTWDSRGRFSNLLWDKYL
jgi:FAD/FMN-containing dehydrogenase